MVEFRKRKSDGQSFPIGNTTKIRANNPSNETGGIKIGKGIRIPPEGDSLHGRGKFVTLDNDVEVFVPSDLSEKQQQASIDIANGNIRDDKIFDIQEVYLINSGGIPERVADNRENFVEGKIVKKIIDNTRKSFGTIPSYNVAKVIKPIFDETGLTFFQGGKAFKVELDESLGIISVENRFQDENDKWHTGDQIVFAQGEDAQELADSAGGFFVNTIMEFLDSSGALEGAR